MAGVTIEYDDREIKAALNRLARTGRELTPAMRSIAGLLESAAQRSFEREESPAGRAWVGLSEVTTIPRRTAQGYCPGSILRVTERLVGSLTSRYDSTSATVGTNLVSAPTHQFGAKQGEFGRTRRGGPIPWGNIPA